MSEISQADQAKTLQTAGVREAEVLQTAGIRDAATLETAGQRDAEILRSAGQRRVNLIWESTQAAIALLVVTITLVVFALSAREGVRGVTPQAVSSLNSSLNALSNVLFLVVGFYFGRTNHVKQGGVGGSSSGLDR